MKRLLPVAAAATTAALLLTGCGSGGEQSGDGKETKKVTVGISQFVEHPSLDAAREGFVEALKDGGYTEGENLTLDVQNASGDQATATNIASNFASSGDDLILGIATPSAQSLAQAVTDKPVLFTAVTDPVDAGLVDSAEAPGGNVTGTTDMNPVADQIKLVKQLEPGAVNHARDVVVDEGRDRVYASSTMTGNIEVFDSKTLEKLDPIVIESAERGEDFSVMALDVDPESGTLVTVSMTTDELAVVDLGSGEVKVHPLPGAVRASGVAYDPKEDLAFVASQETDNLLIVKAATGEDVTADRAEEPVHRLGLGIVQASEEGFARDADEDGKAEGHDLGQAPQGFEVLRPTLAEADTGIEHDVAVAQAGGPRDGQRALEEAQHVGDDVEGRIDGLAVVHDHHGRAVIGGDPGDIGLALQTPDVVDHAGAGLQRHPGGRGLVGVHRDRDGQAGREVADHRQDPNLLLLGRDGHVAGAGGFTADVDDACPFGEHPLRRRPPGGLVAHDAAPDVRRTPNLSVEKRAAAQRLAGPAGPGPGPVAAAGLRPCGGVHLVRREPGHLRAGLGLSGAGIGVGDGVAGQAGQLVPADDHLGGAGVDRAPPGRGA